MEYLLPENTAIKETAEFPDKHRALRIRGGHTRFVSFAHGELLIQEIHAEKYQISVNHFDFVQPAVLRVRTSSPLITLHYMLAGSPHGKAPEFENDTLPAGLYYMFFVPSDREFEVHFDAGRYHSVHVNLRPLFLETFTERFPILKRMIESVRIHARSGIQYLPAAIDFRVRTILHEILFAAIDETETDLFLHSKIYELLWLYVHELKHADSSEVPAPYVKKLVAIKAYILNNLDCQLGTSELSRRFNLSATTLKRHFKQYFNQTVQGFILTQKMEQAKEILLRSDTPVSDIATRIGYAEFSSFTRAFTKHFGHPPSYYRRHLTAVVQFLLLQMVV